MRKNMKKAFAGALLAAAMVMAAQSCDKKCMDGKGEKISGTEAASEGGSIRIIPEKPAVGTMLRAVAAGSGGMAYRWERNGEALATAAETLETSGFKKGDRIRLISGQGGPEDVAETVLINSPPIIKSVSFKPDAFSRGQEIHAQVEGWDADGDAIEYEYQWIIGGQADYSETGPMLGGEGYKKGDEISVRVVPHDGEVKGASFEASAGIVGNSPPRFTSVPPVEFSGTFTYKPKAVDLDSDEVSFSVVNGPEGMKAANNVIEWNAKGQKGSFEVTVAADDGFGGQSLQTFELKVAE